MEQFITKLIRSIIDKSIIKVTLSRARDKNTDLKNVYIKPIMLRGKDFFQFTYHYTKRDETKNYPSEVLPDMVKELLHNNFMNGVIAPIDEDINIMFSKKGTPSYFVKKSVGIREIDYGHDRKKTRLIDATKPWWHELGLTTPEGSIISSMQHKFKQIYKYAEIVYSLINQKKFEGSVSVADMGAGKGYLTFALYEVCNNLSLHADISGIEIRPELVQKINNIIDNFKLTNFRFIASSIEEYNPSKIDILVALHACDTATDDAIIKGIQKKARLIICAPCCNKQIRREMEKSKITNSITRFGIFMERQAVMITDTIRTLILEYYGYSTQVMEFIEIDDTPKNVLICGSKCPKEPSPMEREKIIMKIDELKKQYGIQHHYLENIFDIVKTR